MQNSKWLFISPRKCAQFLTSLVGVLVVLSLIGQVFKYIFGYNHVFSYVPLTDLNAESNIPAWFSSVILVISALLFGVISWIKRSQRDRYTRHWFGLVLIFTYLSLDENVELHERTIAPLRDTIQGTGLLYSSWIVLGGAFVALVILIYWKFLWSLPTKTRNLLIASGAVYVGGALFIESIHGYYLDVHGRDMGYALIASLEESCEMLGIVLLIYTLMSYIQTLGGLQIQFLSQPSTHPAPFMGEEGYTGVEGGYVGEHPGMVGATVFAACAIEAEHDAPHTQPAPAPTGLPNSEN